MKRNRNIAQLGAAVLIAAATNAWANPLTELELDTVAEARLGLGTSGKTLELGEAVLTPALSGWLTDSVYFESSVRARLELTDELEPDRPSNAFRASASQRAIVGSVLDVELRKFHIDVEFGDHVLRLGKQQIVWGEADGLKVLDVVNPQSFREFILPDFDDSRIPLWSANLELAVDEASTVQLIWSPDRTYHDLPDDGARFAITSPRLVPTAPAGVPVRIRSPQRPRRILSDSDAGFRYSTFRGGWELSLNYLYHYLDTPVFRIAPTASGIVLTPEYERTHLVGGSFNYAFGAWVARGELGYSTDQPVLTRAAGVQDGAYLSGDISYVLGLDYDGIRDTFLSGQVFQSVMTDHQAGVVRDELENTFTFLAQRNFRNETITAELLLIHGLNDSDGVMQFELAYDWRSNIEVSVGVDVFYGRRAGLFGQFDKADRLVLGVEIGF